MSQVKLAAKFSRDTQPFNGLMEDDHVADLIKDRETRRYALVAYDVLRVSDEVKDGGRQVPTVELVHIEPVAGETAQRYRSDMRKLFKNRTGRDDEPGRDPEPDPGFLDADGQIPEADGDELLAEHREAQAAQAEG